MSDDNGHNGEPSTNRKTSLSDGGDNRDRRGKWAPGNRAGRGNPHAKKVNRIRAALMKSADPKRIAAAVEKQLQLAEAGDLYALREILDRTIGRAVPADLEERLTALEQAVSERNAEARR